MEAVNFAFETEIDYAMLVKIYGTTEARSTNQTLDTVRVSASVMKNE